MRKVLQVTDQLLTPVPFIWLDFESSGLEDDSLALEFGVIGTDANLKEQWSFSYLIKNEAPPGFIRDMCDPFVREMHTKNHLWDDLIYAHDHPHEVMNYVEPGDLSDTLHGVMAALGYQEKTHPMCGSTVGYDRALMKRHMPMFESWFFYRNIDVSTIKELAKVWAPSIYEDRPNKDEKNKVHRVLDDVRASIDELRYYLDTGFIGAQFLDPEYMPDLAPVSEEVKDLTGGPVTYLTKEGETVI